MRLFVATGLALVLVSCSDGSRGEGAPTPNRQRESTDAAPKLPGPEAWEDALTELLEQVEPPAAIPVLPPRLSRTIPPLRIIDPTHPPSLLFQDPPIGGPWRHPNIPGPGGPRNFFRRTRF